MTAHGRALVLGATGFIGSNLTKRLVADGWSVAQAVRTQPATEVLGAETLEISNFRSDLGPAVRHAQPDVVFNLASAGVGTPASPEELNAGNAGIVASLLDALDPDVTKVVIHAGSWSQYGPFAGTLTINEDHQQHATTPYGEAKAEAEAQGRKMSDSIGIPFVTLRLFNVYGPGEQRHRLIPSIVESTNSGGTPELTPGAQIRDFVYIDDVVNAFMSCADIDPMTTEAFNVATGHGTSVRAVAEMAADYLGIDRSSLGFGAKAPRPGEPTHVVGDASALTARTGWRPYVSVSEGVRDTVRWAMEKATHNG